MSPRVFWPLIFGLTILNFGIDLVVAGANNLSKQEFLVMTGSWLVIAGVGVLVYLIVSTGGMKNGRRRAENGKPSGAGKAPAPGQEGT
jgi:hypothetical protein